MIFPPVNGGNIVRKILIRNVYKRRLKRSRMAYMLADRDWKVRDNKRRKSKQAEEKQ